MYTQTNIRTGAKEHGDNDSTQLLVCLKTLTLPIDLNDLRRNEQYIKETA